MADDDDESSYSHKNHRKFAINISKGGGIGIGVGIILVGGAFLANFFLNKPPKKPTNKNHLQDQDDDRSEKAIGSGVSRDLSAHNLFEDGDHTFENDDQAMEMECNGSVVETDELWSSEITDSLIHQPIREEADVILVSCIEVNCGSIDHGEEKSTSNAENVCRRSEGSLNITDETNATFEADQGDEDKINIAIIGTEGENRWDDNTTQYDGLIDRVQVDANIGHLIASDARVFEVETNVETEVIEENKAQDRALDDTQLDVHTNAVGETAKTDSSIERTSILMEYHVMKEAIQHDAHTNALQEAAEMDSSIEHTTESVECQVIEVKEAQHDVQINAAGEAVEIDSVSNKSSEMIEIQTIPDQDHSHISRLITTDNISSSDSSIMGKLNPTKDVGIDLHSIESVTEKDIIYQETDESSQEHLVNPITGENIQDGSQTLIAENVDDISQGSLVQAKDRNVTPQETENKIHYKEIEDDDATSSENIHTLKIEKGVSNMNIFKKDMVKSTQQKNDDEKTSLLMRKRGPILIGTTAALLWRPLCYYCLIAVLAMVIYKIQGF